jgi:hypothetical protein
VGGAVGESGGNAEGGASGLPPCGLGVRRRWQRGRGPRRRRPSHAPPAPTPTHHPPPARALRRPLDVPTLLLHGDSDVALGMPLLAGTEAAFDPAGGGSVDIKVLENCSHWIQQVGWFRGRVRETAGAGGSGKGGKAERDGCCSSPPARPSSPNPNPNPNPHSTPPPQDYPLQVNGIMREWLSQQDARKGKGQ